MLQLARIKMPLDLDDDIGDIDDTDDSSEQSSDESREEELQIDSSERKWEDENFDPQPLSPSRSVNISPAFRADSQQIPTSTAESPTKAESSAAQAESSAARAESRAAKAQSPAAQAESSAAKAAPVLDELGDGACPNLPPTSPVELQNKVFIIEDISLPKTAVVEVFVGGETLLVTDKQSRIPRLIKSKLVKPVGELRTTTRSKTANEKAGDGSPSLIPVSLLATGKRKALSPGTPTTSKVRKLPTTPAATVEVNFKSGTMPPPALTPIKLTYDAEEDKSYLDYFYQYFTIEMFEHITTQTNIFLLCKDASATPFGLEDLKKLVAIELIMGVVSMPSYTDYFRADYGYHIIKNIMTLKKYEKLRTNLHFVNNDEADETDGYFKIRPFIELLRQQCINTPNEQRQSVDEMMIAYKGVKAGYRKQYMPNKPCKWGFKAFVRAGISGMVYDFIIYDGAETLKNIEFDADEINLCFTTKIVLALAKTVNISQPTICFDNFFTSFLLLSLLRDRYGIQALGTVRANRLSKTVITIKKNSPRGTFIELHDKQLNLSLVKWLDKKEILLASNYIGAEPVGIASRYDKAQKLKIDVPCPNIVREYNETMGGVDLADMLVSLHKTKFRTQRWYMALFGQALDISLNNAWLLMRRDYLTNYNEDSRVMLKDFRLKVSELLSQTQPAPVPEMTVAELGWAKGSRPPDRIRYDHIDHIATVADTQRCKFEGCTQKSSIWCGKCKVALCLKKERNHMADFHIKPSTSKK